MVNELAECRDSLPSVTALTDGAIDGYYTQLANAGRPRVEPESPAMPPVPAAERVIGTVGDTAGLRYGGPCQMDVHLAHPDR